MSLNAGPDQTLILRTTDKYYIFIYTYYQDHSMKLNGYAPYVDKIFPAITALTTKLPLLIKAQNSFIYY
jgi:hypothetical protein